jgi:NADPH:quinone reductase-like Zn-dependent oxidoreductase
VAPKNFKLVDVTVGDPGPGEIRIRHNAIGLNFIDVYQRSGLYPLPHARSSAWKAPAWRRWARASRT